MHPHSLFYSVDVSAVNHLVKGEGGGEGGGGADEQKAIIIQIS